MREHKALSTSTETSAFPITLDFPEGKIVAEINLRPGPERLVVLAFKMLAISSEVADMATRAAEKLGFEVSCNKGCGACCRQLVPLSPPEAAMIFEFVESMPEPQKSEVRIRFSVAIRHLKEICLLEKLERLQNPLMNNEEYDAITREYFLAQVPCPFLVNECCSIHEVRPSMCREYLVNSPAENCKNPKSGRITRLPISLRLSEALARTWASISKEHVQVVPLILALEWTKKNESARSTGADSVQLLTTLLGHISDIAGKREQEVTRRSKDKTAVPAPSLDSHGNPG